MSKRGISVPSSIYPIAAFLIWFHLFFSYLPTLEFDIDFASQNLQSSFFTCNLILILSWFLCSRQIFYIFSIVTVLTTGYLFLALGKAGILIEIGVVAFIYTWLSALTHWIENQKLQDLVRREKIQSRLNVAHKHMREKEHLLAALKKKLDRLNYLREFSDWLKESLSVRSTGQIVAREVEKLMPQIDQVLIFIIDEKSHDLGLISHYSRESAYPIKDKKGNEFDHWVIRRSQPLLIEDVNSDFRFTAHKESQTPFHSVCIAPLISEQKVFGLIHLNAESAGTFHTDDLRFLDIVADLSSVSLKNVLLYEKTRELSIIDSLTECYLLRHIQERLTEEIQRSVRGKIPFSVLMIDIDYFKKYNDEFGHTAGDIVLKEIAEILRKSVRSTDIVGRYGGEEFVIILPRKGPKEAFAVAEKVRKEVGRREFNLRKEKRKITISLGISVFPEDGTTKEELFWKADKYLYEAKRKGRNRTCGRV